MTNSIANKKIGNFELSPLAGLFLLCLEAILDVIVNYARIERDEEPAVDVSAPNHVFLLPLPIAQR